MAFISHLSRSALCIHSWYILVLVLLHICHMCVYADETTSITIDNLKHHMAAIASDDTEGRFTGTTGFKKAADYVANVLQKLDLKKPFKDNQGNATWFQPVPFVRKHYDSTTSIILRKAGKDTIYSHSPETFAVINPGKKYQSLPFASPVFVGYGIHEPDLGWDDYADQDVKGKWVILLDGIPPKSHKHPTFPNKLRRQYTNAYDSLKFKALSKHQIAGATVIHNENSAENWETSVIRKYRFNYLNYVKSDTTNNTTPERSFPSILIHPQIAQSLLTGQPFHPWEQKGSYRSFTLKDIQISVTIDCRERKINCYNVGALVPGTDPSLKHEVVTVGAHLDHLGRIGNSIYNGANDDASGCAIILEAAKTLIQNPPRRPVLLVFYTGEEVGMIGSRHFIAYPPIPKDHIVLNINIEQIGSKNRTIAGITAFGPKQFSNQFIKSGLLFNKNDLQYVPLEDNVEIIFDTDSEYFYRNGIPSIIMGSGGFSEYHSPLDEIDLIDFEHLHKSAHLLYTFIKNLADQQCSTINRSFLDTLPQWQEELQVPAVGIGIIEEGKISYVKVFGELQKEDPAPINTIFNIASQTKPVVGMMVLKLVSSGQWDLDEPLYKYWIDPDIENDPHLKKLTTRHVLSHQTGFLNSRVNHPSGRLTFEFEPGTQYRYSGEGFEYLARALENKFDTPLEVLLDRIILKPLGMIDTQYWEQNLDTTRLARWHDSSGNRYQMSQRTGVSAADDLLSTIEDYCKLGIDVMNGAGLSPALYKEMTNTQVEVKNNYYRGLGWGLVTRLPNGEYAIEHGGADIGVRTMAVFLPQSQRGIVIMSNGDNGIFLIDRILKESLDVGSQILQSMNQPVETSEVVNLSDNVIQQYVGQYRQPNGRVMRVIQEGNAIKVSGEGIPTGILYPKSRNTFFLPNYDVQLEFRNETDTSVRMTIYENGKSVMQAVKIR